jgi:hypothetical protein
MTTTYIPDFMDEVSNIISGVSGTVVATYNISGVDYIDVRVGERMYYKMVRSNWKVIKKYEE